MTLAVAAVAALQIALSTPQPNAELDSARLKGEFTRLAWSEDGAELYVQTAERDRAGNLKAVHHIVVTSASKTVKDVDKEPAWAAKYWQWKSSQASPGDAAFRIIVDERTDTKRTVSAPTGGDLARGGTPNPTAGTSIGDVAAAANTAQTLHVFSLKVKDETIGEWLNAPVTPGTTFSWAPAPLRLLAFAKRDGGPIVVIDANGGRAELSGTKSALLPAWSADGKRLAWLERKGKKYQLTIAEISAQ